MVIYKTTNLINGKIYIGQNKNNNKNYLGSGTTLKLAIKKYGKENFKKEILCECSCIDELNEKEKYYIKLFDSTNLKIGYNRSIGGAGPTGIETSEETRQKLSIALKGKKKSKTTRQRMSDSRKNMSQQKKEEVYKWSDERRKKASENMTGEKHRNYGKHLPTETKEKIRKTNTGKKKSKETLLKISKSIIEYDMNMNIIKEWESIKAAAEYYSVSSTTIIRKTKAKSWNNKIFRYKE